MFRVTEKLLFGAVAFFAGTWGALFEGLLSILLIAGILLAVATRDRKSVV